MHSPELESDSASAAFALKLASAELLSDADPDAVVESPYDASRLHSSELEPDPEDS